MVDGAGRARAPVPMVTVIVVTYSSRETIGPTLDGLKDACDEGLARAVVVDNASPDGTADLVAERYPRVDLIRSQRNVGFGRGCNLGLRRASTPFVLLLNPDAVIDAESIRALIHLLEQTPVAGICGPAVLEESGNLQPSGALPTPLRVMLRPVLPGWTSRGRKWVKRGDAPSRTDWICGSIMLIRRSMLAEIGGFDPRFFLYFEETDLCRRAQNAGWEIWTTGEAIARHVNAASTRKAPGRFLGGAIAEHYFRSRFYYLRKHFGVVAAVTAELGEILFMGLAAVSGALRGRRPKALLARLASPVLRVPGRMGGKRWIGESVF